MQSATWAIGMTGLALTTLAQSTTVWNPAANPTGHGYWNEAANWTGSAVPGSGDKAVFNVPDALTCTINSSANVGQLVMGDGGPGSLVVAAGGSFASGNNWTGVGYNNVATFEVQAGASAIFNDHLWVGFEATGDGTFVVNGGTAFVHGMFGLGWNGGKGTAKIQGGTLNLSQWHPTDSIKGSSSLDITAGKVVITGNFVNSVNDFVTAGKITSYGGAGTVADVFDADSNTTTISAVKPPGFGPFAPTNWPASLDATKKVHYYVADGAFAPPNDNWTDTLTLPSGGDQILADSSVKGFAGKRAVSSFINVADAAFQEWNTSDRIDILMQVYGDTAVLRPTDLSQSRRIRFLIGTVPQVLEVQGGDYATNAYNGRWNWILFSIENPLINGGPDHKVGSVPEGSVGDVTFGGVNGGTIRLQGPDNAVGNLTVHAIAFGEAGAFGIPEQVNQFDVPDVSCGPVPVSNLAEIDLNAGLTNHLVVLNNNDQTVTFSSDVGPATDRRKAVTPVGQYLNFGITEEYLGKACHDNAVIKVCVDFYDDPSFAGAEVSFGPEAYALDSNGTPAIFPEDQRQIMQGSGQWIRRSWSISSVNLVGIGTSPLTGGVRFISSGGQVAVSRFSLGIIRTGNHPLAGLDPLADCYSDPQICQNVYKDFAELDLAKDIKNGLDVGSSGGDQVMIVEEGGPVDDRRMAVRPSFGDTGTGEFLNFAITDTIFGPTSQPNARLAIVVTYYDDPALVGKGFRPEVWKVESGGQEVFSFFQPKNNIVLQGTGKWRDAYWEIPAIKFSGVNQGPQAAARFRLEDRIYVTRVRYAVIRPCGTNAGKNLLESVKPALHIATEADGVHLTWPYRAPQGVLESAETLGGGWTTFPNAPAIETPESFGLQLTPGPGTQFFRLTVQ
ncbi:MAG TPA: hypothetical protein VMF06_22935 [Candidatus Limnocylindria bacterium]|nr:hypothetical protein [Candidatus Limnocylindria bacterium]